MTLPGMMCLLEFADAEDMPKANREYFRELIEGVCGARTQLDLDIAQWTDRPAAQLDPVEHAVLLVAAFELTSRPEGPVSRRAERSGESHAPLWRYGRSQVRECRARPCRPRPAYARTVTCHCPNLI